MAVSPLVYVEPIASDFEERQAKARVQHRIILDCFNAKTDGNWCKCSKGYPLHHNCKDGSLDLISVLKGYSTKSCQECPNYDA